MSWNVKFHGKAIKELNSLPRSLHNKFLSLFDKIKNDGLAWLPKNSVKKIHDDIWELRVIGEDGIARSLFVSEEEQTFRMLLFFVKKTQKLPPRSIDIARRRRDDK